MISNITKEFHTASCNDVRMNSTQCPSHDIIKVLVRVFELFFSHFGVDATDVFIHLLIILAHTDMDMMSIYTIAKCFVHTM